MTKRSTQSPSFLPLTPVAFEILMALADGEVLAARSLRLFKRSGA